MVFVWAISYVCHIYSLHILYSLFAILSSWVIAPFILLHTSGRSFWHYEALCYDMEQLITHSNSLLCYAVLWTFGYGTLSKFIADYYHFWKQGRLYRKIRNKHHRFDTDWLQTDLLCLMFLVYPKWRFVKSVCLINFESMGFQK